MRSKSKKKILFIADPWETLDHQRDSTLYLAHYAETKLNSECYWTTESDLFFIKNKLHTRLQGKIQNPLFEPKLIPLKSPEIELDRFDSIHWRVDPPVHLSTFRLWSLLDSLASEVRIINAPSALLRFNEKFSVLQFKQWSIPALYSNSLEQILQHCKKTGNDKLVIKSVAEAASRGILLVSPSDSKAQDSIRDFYKLHGPWLVVQNFLPEILSHGESRAFVVDGKIVGSICKIPHKSKPIMSLDAPIELRPQLKVRSLTPTQKSRANTIAKFLKTQGVVLATIDFIGEKLLEINVTSPGLLRWFDSECGKPVIASRYFDAIIKIKGKGK